MQVECLNCHEHFEVDADVSPEPDDARLAGLTADEFGERLLDESYRAVHLVQGCVDSDGTWQVRGGLDLEIVYHECPAGFFTTPTNVVRFVRLDDADGSAGVTARLPEPPAGPATAMHREGEK